PARGRACGLLSLAPVPCSLPRRSLRFTCLAFQALRLQPPVRSPDRFNTYVSASWASRCAAGLGFAIPSQARQTARPSRVCHPPPSRGQALRIARSPRVALHLASRLTQLPPASGLVGSPGLDFHLPDMTRLRTHGGRPAPPAMTRGTGRCLTAIFVAGPFDVEVRHAMLSPMDGDPPRLTSMDRDR